VHTDVEHFAASPDLAVNPEFNRMAMREVVSIEQGRLLGAIETLGKFREESWVTDGAIEVHQKSGHHTRIQWNMKRSF